MATLSSSAPSHHGSTQQWPLLHRKDYQGSEMPAVISPSRLVPNISTGPEPMVTARLGLGQMVTLSPRRLAEQHYGLPRRPVHRARTARGRAGPVPGFIGTAILASALQVHRATATLPGPAAIIITGKFFRQDLTQALSPPGSVTVPLLNSSYEAAFHWQLFSSRHWHWTRKFRVN
jgi:hypothetical protein